MIHSETDDFFVRLTVAQPRLSAKMTQLAAYVSEHYVQVAFMTTRQLAAAAGVSPGTVVRFPAVLGYRDFEELRSSIQDRVNLDLAGVKRLQTLPTDSQSPAALLNRVVQADMANLNTLVQSFAEPPFSALVEALRTAERIMVLGVRYVSPLALYCGDALDQIKPNVTTYTRADSSLYDRLYLSSQQDVLLIIAFVPYPADMVALVRFAHTRGVRILTITDSPLSAVLPLADVGLLVKIDTPDFVSSLAAPVALINAIVLELGWRLGEAATQRLQLLSEAASEAGLYVRAGYRMAATPAGAAPEHTTETMHSGHGKPTDS